MPKAMARHILVKTEAEAAALKKRIAAGEAFDVLAKKYSTCPSGKRGGDLGEVRPGQMVGAIDQVIFKKPLRVVHGPIKSKNFVVQKVGDVLRLKKLETFHFMMAGPEGAVVCEWANYHDNAGLRFTHPTATL